MTLIGMSSPSSFDTLAQAAFAKTVVAVSPYISLPNQIHVMNAADSLSRHRRLQKSATPRLKRRLDDTTGLVVFFEIEINVDEASDGSGKTYDISGPVRDDDWWSSNTTLALAIQLIDDLTEGIYNATMTSTWQLTAEGVVGEIPLRLTLGDPPDLTAAPGLVSYETSSVKVAVCHWDSDCGAVTPSPTLPHPSPVPTPAPTKTPDYRLNFVNASIPFALLALIQVAVGVGLVRKHIQHARAKAKARSDATLSAEKVSSGNISVLLNYIITICLVFVFIPGEV
jgi:hypothetical protein